MTLISNSVTADVILLVISLTMIAYWYLSKTLDYWKKRNVPFPKPHIVFGNFKDVFFRKMAYCDVSLHMYNKFKEEQYSGHFNHSQPIFVVQDLKLIERVLTTDFTYFYNRNSPINLSRLLHKSLSHARDGRWRTLRCKLNPAFKSSKIKGMFEQIFNCTNIILQSIDETLRTKDIFDVLPLLFKYGNDVIASCAFGINIYAESSQRSKFVEMVKKTFSSNLKGSLIFILGLLSPKLVYLLGLQLIPTEVEDYFINLTKATIEYRKKNNIHRQDFLQLFLNLKEEEEKNVNNQDNELSSDDIPPGCPSEKDETIAAALFSFLFIGSEYVSNTLGFALLELANAPEIQRRLQEEVNTCITKHGAWTYNALKDMVYLDQVLQETIRLHPVGSPVNRCVSKKYNVPGSDLVLDPGLAVVIPVAAIHRDPQYYPSPLQFNPDRFLDNNYKPSPTFLPFGQGPRICIVMQFAILELKVCLARIVSRFSFTLSHKSQPPFLNDPKNRFPKPLGGVWLTFNQRSV